MANDLPITITPEVTDDHDEHTEIVHATLRPWRDLRAGAIGVVGATPGTDTTALLQQMLADGVDVKVPAAGHEDGGNIWFGISDNVNLNYSGEPLANRSLNPSGQRLFGQGKGRSVLKALSPAARITCHGDVQGYFWGALRKLTLDGNNLVDKFVVLQDQASQGLIDDVEVKNCHGNPGTGITNDTGLANARTFSWSLRRLTVWENNVGVYLIKNYQAGAITSSDIFGNLVNQVKLGDGVQFTANFTIAHSHIERANFSTGGDVVNILVNGLDVLNLIDVYQESHTTANSHDIEYVGLSAGIGVAAQGEPLRLNVSGLYAGGTNPAAHWLVLPTDGTRIEVNLAGTVLVTGYASSPIQNEDQAAIVINDPSGSLTRSTLLDAKYFYGDVLSSPLGGFGRYENQLQHSDDFDDGAWEKAAFTNPCTVDANAATAPNGEAIADRINFGAVNSGFRQSDAGAAIAGDYRCASIWLRTEGTPGPCILSLNVPTGGKTITKNIFVTNTWRRFRLAWQVPAGGSGICYMRLQNGFAASPASVLAWRGQMDWAPNAGPPVKTAGARRAAGYGLVINGQPLPITGWADPTGTLSRAAFDQSTVTLPVLAQHVAALVTDLKAAHVLAT